MTEEQKQQVIAEISQALQEAEALHRELTAQIEAARASIIQLQNTPAEQLDEADWHEDDDQA